jgi:hypothetical protein
MRPTPRENPSSAPSGRFEPGLIAFFHACPVLL